MTDSWNHLGGVAEKVCNRVAEMKGSAISDNVVPLFPEKPEPQLPDPRTFQYQDAVGQFAEGLYRLCIRAEKDLGVHSVRGVVAAVLAEIDDQIEKDGGGST